MSDKKKIEIINLGESPIFKAAHTIQALWEIREYLARQIGLPARFFDDINDEVEEILKMRNEES